MHGGHSCLRFQEAFKVKPKKGAGVRWYVKWEQHVQIQGVGLERLLRNVVDVCVENKWSEKSARKMQAAAEDPGVLSKALVELAAEKDAGRHFCYATYWLEGDQFIAPLAHGIIDKLRLLLEGDGIFLPEVEEAARRAAELMAPVWAERIGRITDAEAAVVTAREVLRIAEGAVNARPASARVPNRGRQQRQAAIAAPNAADVLRGNVQQRREEGAAAHLALVASVTDASAALAVAQEGEASVKIAHAQWRTKIGFYFHFCSDFFYLFLYLFVLLFFRSADGTRVQSTRPSSREARLRLLRHVVPRGKGET